MPHYRTSTEYASLIFKLVVLFIGLVASGGLIFTLIAIAATGNLPGSAQ